MLWLGFGRFWRVVKAACSLLERAGCLQQPSQVKVLLSSAALCTHVRAASPMAVLHKYVDLRPQVPSGASCCLGVKAADAANQLPAFIEVLCACGVWVCGLEAP